MILHNFLLAVVVVAMFFSDLGNAELNFNFVLVIHNRDGDCEEVLLAMEDVFSGNEGTAPPPNPYEDASLAKEDSQSLADVARDDGLDEEKWTVKVLLSLDSDEFIVTVSVFVFRLLALFGWGKMNLTALFQIRNQSWLGLFISKSEPICASIELHFADVER
jgi:hypothetical protein